MSRVPSRLTRRPALRAGVLVLTLLGLAVSLGGCIIAPAPYYARPYPHYYYWR